MNIIEQTTTNKLLGYARVSAEDQNLDRQTEALMRNGVRPEDIYREYRSGKNIADRPELQRCLSYLRSGDTLVVLDIDRLSRNLLEGLQILIQLSNSGVRFKSINQGELNINGSPEDSLKLGIFLVFAEYERKKIHTRIQHAREHAYNLGKHFGRPYDNVNGVFTDQHKEDLAKLVITLYTDKTNNYSTQEICNATGITRGTLYRLLRIKGIKIDRIFKDSK